MEHHFKLLHQNDFGYTAICESCNNIHVELGNFLSIVCFPSFRLIVKDFASKKDFKSYFLSHSPSGEKLMIQITDNTFISITETEFDDAIELLEVSAHLLEAISIINA